MPIITTIHYDGTDIVNMRIKNQGEERYQENPERRRLRLRDKAAEDSPITSLSETSGEHNDRMNWYKDVYRHRQAFPVIATDSDDEPALDGPDHSATSPTVSSADGFSPSPAFSPASPAFLRGSGGSKSPAYVPTVYPAGAYGTPPHSPGNGGDKPHTPRSPTPDHVRQAFDILLSEPPSPISEQATVSDRVDTSASAAQQAADDHKVEAGGDHHVDGHPAFAKLESYLRSCLSEQQQESLCETNKDADPRNSVSLARLQEIMEKLSLIMQEKNEILKKDLEVTMKNHEISKAQAEAAKALDAADRCLRIQAKAAEDRDARASKMKEEEREHEVRLLQIKEDADERLVLARYKHMENLKAIELQHCRKILSEQAERANEEKLKDKTPEQLQSEQSGRAEQEKEEAKELKQLASIQMERQHKERMRAMDLELAKGENESKERIKAMELEGTQNQRTHQLQMKTLELDQMRKGEQSERRHKEKLRLFEMEHELELGSKNQAKKSKIGQVQ